MRPYSYQSGLFVGFGMMDVNEGKRSLMYW